MVTRPWLLAADVPLLESGASSKHRICDVWESGENPELSRSGEGAAVGERHWEGSWEGAEGVSSPSPKTGWTRPCQSGPA